MSQTIIADCGENVGYHVNKLKMFCNASSMIALISLVPQLDSYEVLKIETESFWCINEITWFILHNFELKEYWIKIDK